MKDLSLGDLSSLSGFFFGSDSGQGLPPTSKASDGASTGDSNGPEISPIIAEGDYAFSPGGTFVGGRGSVRTLEAFPQPGDSSSEVSTLSSHKTVSQTENSTIGSVNESLPSTAPSSVKIDTSPPEDTKASQPKLNKGPQTFDAMKALICVDQTGGRMALRKSECSSNPLARKR